MSCAHNCSLMGGDTPLYSDSACNRGKASEFFWLYPLVNTLQIYFCKKYNLYKNIYKESKQEVGFLSFWDKGKYPMLLIVLHIDFCTFFQNTV